MQDSARIFVHYIDFSFCIRLTLSTESHRFSVFPIFLETFFQGCSYVSMTKEKVQYLESSGNCGDIIHIFFVFLNLCCHDIYKIYLPHKSVTDLFFPPINRRRKIV